MLASPVFSRHATNLTACTATIGLWYTYNTHGFNMAQQKDSAIHRVWWFISTTKLKYVKCGFPKQGYSPSNSTLYWVQTHMTTETIEYARKTSHMKKTTARQLYTIIILLQSIIYTSCPVVLAVHLERPDQGSTIHQTEQFRREVAIPTHLAHSIYIRCSLYAS